MNQDQFEHVPVVPLCRLSPDGGDDHNVGDDTEQPQYHVHHHHHPALHLVARSGGRVHIHGRTGQL